MGAKAAEISVFLESAANPVYSCGRSLRVLLLLVALPLFTNSFRPCHPTAFQLPPRPHACKCTQHHLMLRGSFLYGRARARESATPTRFPRRAPRKGALSLRARGIEYGDVVKVHYVGKLENGEEWDNTVEPGSEPLEFKVGGNRTIEGLEKALLGMSKGHKKVAHIDCEEAFGLRRASRIVNISAMYCPEDLHVGQHLGMSGLHAIVTDIHEDGGVTVDANHPLAGEDVILELEVVDHIKSEDLEVATLAGGCFWGLELAFQRVNGVMATKVGYTQGHLEDPTYARVLNQDTGHVEAVMVTFDPRRLSFLDLLEVYFSQVDVTQLNRQGSDVGPQYRSGIYYHNEKQRLQGEQALLLVQKQLDERPFYGAEESREAGRPTEQENCTVVTELKPNATFWVAEERHQQFLEKLGQKSYKGCSDPINCVMEVEVNGTMEDIGPKNLFFDDEDPENDYENVEGLYGTGTVGEW